MGRGVTYFVVSLVGLVVASPALLVIGLRTGDRWIVVLAALAFAAFAGAFIAFAGAL
jgi:hypothetical protein